MKEEIISFETAKLAKEKGFDVKGNIFYVLNTFKPKSHIGKSYTWHFKGFLIDEYKFLDETCCPCHNVQEDNRVFAPTQSLLQKWLREKHNIVVYILPHAPNKKLDDGVRLYSSCLWYKNEYQSEIKSNKTYEGALEIGLQEALKLIKL